MDNKFLNHELKPNLKEIEKEMDKYLNSLKNNEFVLIDKNFISSMMIEGIQTKNILLEMTMLREKGLASSKEYSDLLNVFKEKHDNVYPSLLKKLNKLIEESYNRINVNISISDFNNLKNIIKFAFRDIKV